MLIEYESALLRDVPSQDESADSQSRAPWEQMYSFALKAMTEAPPEAGRSPVIERPLLLPPLAQMQSSPKSLSPVAATEKEREALAALTKLPKPQQQELLEELVKMETVLTVPAPNKTKQKQFRAHRMTQKRPRQVRQRRRRPRHARRAQTNTRENDAPETLDVKDMPVVVQAGLYKLWRCVRGSQKYFREVYPPEICDEEKLRVRILADFGIRFSERDCAKILSWMRTLDTSKREVRYGRVVRVAVKLGPELQKLRDQTNSSPQKKQSPIFTPRSHLPSRSPSPPAKGHLRPGEAPSRGLESALEALHGAARRRGNFLRRELTRLKREKGASLASAAELKKELQRGVGLHLRPPEWTALLAHLSATEGRAIDLQNVYVKVLQMSHVSFPKESDGSQVERRATMGRPTPERPSATVLPKQSTKPTARKRTTQKSYHASRTSVLPRKAGNPAPPSGSESGAIAPRSKSSSKSAAVAEQDDATIMTIQAEAEARARAAAEEAKKKRIMKEQVRRRSFDPSVEDSSPDDSRNRIRGRDPTRPEVEEEDSSSGRESQRGRGKLHEILSRPNDAAIGGVPEKTQEKQTLRETQKTREGLGELQSGKQVPTAQTDGKNQTQMEDINSGSSTATEPRKDSPGRRGSPFQSEADKGDTTDRQSTEQANRHAPPEALFGGQAVQADDASMRKIGVEQESNGVRSQDSVIPDRMTKRDWVPKSGAGNSSTYADQVLREEGERSKDKRVQEDKRISLEWMSERNWVPKSGASDSRTSTDEVPRKEGGTGKDRTTGENEKIIPECIAERDWTPKPNAGDSKTPTDEVRREDGESEEARTMKESDRMIPERMYERGWTPSLDVSCSKTSVEETKHQEKTEREKQSEKDNAKRGKEQDEEDQFWTENDIEANKFSKSKEIEEEPDQSSLVDSEFDEYYTDDNFDEESAAAARPAIEYVEASQMLGPRHSAGEHEAQAPIVTQRRSEDQDSEEEDYNDIFEDDFET